MTTVRSEDGKKIGEVHEDVFRQYIKTKHILKKPPGLCYDVTSLKDIENLGVRTLEKNNLETGDIYTVPLSKFREKAFPMNRGFNDQMCLPLQYWSKNANL